MMKGTLPKEVRSLPRFVYVDHGHIGHKRSKTAIMVRYEIDTNMLPRQQTQRPSSNKYVPHTGKKQLAKMARV